MGDTIGLCPPLIIENSHVDKIGTAFAKTLSEIETEVSGLYQPA
jgi:adenosylmethionine-8-amino-7-oxononanoate aminotransferase